MARLTREKHTLQNAGLWLSCFRPSCPKPINRFWQEHMPTNQPPKQALANQDHMHPRINFPRGISEFLAHRRKAGSSQRHRDECVLSKICRNAWLPSLCIQNWNMQKGNGSAERLLQARCHSGPPPLSCERFNSKSLLC